MEGYISNAGESNQWTIKSHELGTRYNWTEMKKLATPAAFYAAEADVAQNVGQLLYDVGTLLQVNYSRYGTGGNLRRLATQMSEHMGYSRAAIERLYEVGYPRWKWEQMLVEQLDQHPIYYSGEDYNGSTNPDDWEGHAYVVDGYGTYNTGLVFHFNCGWGGSCNGYYYSDYQQTPTSDNDYWEDVSALFGFVPDYSGTSEYTTGLSYVDYGDKGGIFLTQSLNANNQIRVRLNNIYNYGSQDFSANMAAFLIDPDGVREEEAISTWSGSFLRGRVYESNRTLNLKRAAVFGDKVSIFYGEEDSAYRQLAFEEPSCGVSELPLFPAAFIQTKALYSAGDYFEFRLTNHNFAYDKAVWRITDPLKNTEIYPQSQGRVLLTHPGKYTIKVTPVEGGETIVTVINVN